MRDLIILHYIITRIPRMEKRYIDTPIVNGYWTCPDCGKVLKVNDEKNLVGQIRSHLNSRRHQEMSARSSDNIIGLKAKIDGMKNELDELKQVVNDLKSKFIDVLMKT